MTVVNACLNPYMHDDYAGWFPTNAEHSRVALTGFARGFGGRVTGIATTTFISGPPVAVSAGQTWTGSLSVRCTAAVTVRVFLEFHDAANALISQTGTTSFPLTANTVTRVAATGTAPGGTDHIVISVYYEPPTTGDQLDATMCRYAQDTDPTYFDGDSAGWLWSDVVGLSASALHVAGAMWSNTNPSMVWDTTTAAWMDRSLIVVDAPSMLTDASMRNVTVTATGVITSTNRPANPALILYGSTSGTASAWAHPGALIIAGRDNYDAAAFHTMAAGGATVIMYLDVMINNTTGRYHDKLINSSEFGAAVPLWPGPLVANAYGSVNDFRVGGTLQSKLLGVLELIRTENPHISGIFLDDCGTRSWFPNFNWSSLTNTAKEQWRNGAIATVQTCRTWANEHDMFIMVNGTWGAVGSSGIGDGGYPTRGTPGCSIADGGFVENHDPATEMAYWTSYAGSAQWGAATPRGIGYMWFSNVGSASERDAWISAGLAAFGNSADYSSGIVAPFGSFTDFHIPHR